MKNKIITFLCLSIALFTPKALASRWYHDYAHQHKGADYQRNCSLIEFAQKIRGAALLVYHRVTHKKTNPDYALKKIDAQLASFKTYLLDEEQDILLTIKSKYYINDAVWDQCMADIAWLKKSYSDAMMHHHPEVIHDTAIPANIMEMIKKLLEQNNINPKSINLIMANEEPAKNNAQVAMRTYLYINMPHDSNSLVDDKYNPASIVIFPKLLSYSFEEQTSLCAHEVQHLVANHAVVDFVLGKYLQKYCSLEVAQFQQSEEYLLLSQIEEAQAEVFAAIKDPHVAHCMKKLRKQIYYPGHLYEEHFYHITTIDMLWKLKAKLKQISRQ